MLKVLLVEDEDLIRKGLRYIVDWQSVDCTVVGEAENGSEGLRLIAELAPDVVLTDVKMPVLDGLQMLSQSIAEYGYKAIIISGYDEFAYAQKAVSLGVTEYLLKPVDFDLLYAALRKIVGAREREDGQRASGAENAAAPDVALPPSAASKAENKYVRIMLAYIEANYAERISLMDVSAEQDISCAYLNAKFKAETGYPFNDYLNRFRVSQAVRLLRQCPSAKVYEIAERVGFPDYKYFIKVFKKYTGYTPGRFQGDEAAGGAKGGGAEADGDFGAGVATDGGGASRPTLRLVLTDGRDPRFAALCAQLDAHLNAAVGARKQREEYTKYNGLDEIKDAALMLDGETPVACAAFKRRDGQTAELKRVFVQPEYRGRRIARQLVERLEQEARGRGFERMLLETGKPLEAARVMYARMGYRVVDNFPPYVGMDGSVCMEKELA